MRRSTSSRQLADQAVRELKAAADPRIAAGSRAYFKAYEDVEFFGLKTAPVRQIERKLFLQIRGEWRIDEAISFCEILIKRRELEAKNTGILLLSRYKKSFDKNLWAKVEGWLNSNYCSDWASTDSLASTIIARLVEQNPQLIIKLKSWTKRKNLWLRRAAAVAMTPSARHGKNLEDAYEIAESLFIYPEDLIHKAAGWLLREAGKTNPKHLEDFLLARGPHIPRTTLRYAIERFSPAKRRMLLAATRAASNK
jgi:3-methyladenine DNA glycosylase AlkD